MEMQFGNLDVPLYTGRLTGLRSFSISDKAELTGVAYAGRWVDGENQAKCAQRDSSFYTWDAARGAGVNHEEAHQVASLDCSCGYYAFFDGNNNEYQNGINVEGVIEAWGKITIGEKGFRASKARIVALVVPIEKFPTNWADKLAHRLSCSASFGASHGWSYPYLAHEAGCDLPLFPEPSRMRAIIRRYSTAQIFSTLEEATAAFPLTPVEAARKIVGE